MQSLASGERRTLVEGGSDARYLPIGHLVYTLGGIVLAVPFDPAGLLTTGGAGSVLEGARKRTSRRSSCPGSVPCGGSPSAAATAFRTGLPTAGASPSSPIVTAIWRSSRSASLADGKVTRFRDILSRDPIGSVFSPDGRWIAYHTLPPGASSTSGNSGVFVEPFPPTDALYQAPRVSRDFMPVWSRDGDELFYIGTTTSGVAAAVPVTTRSGIAFGPLATFPFVVTAGRLSASTRGFDALPNNAFVGVVAESASDRVGANNEVRVVLNWFKELKRRVPLP